MLLLPILNVFMHLTFNNDSDIYFQFSAQACLISPNRWAITRRTLFIDLCSARAPIHRESIPSDYSACHALMQDGIFIVSFFIEQSNHKSVIFFYNKL